MKYSIAIIFLFISNIFFCQENRMNDLLREIETLNLNLVEDCHCDSLKVQFDFAKFDSIKNKEKEDVYPEVYLHIQENKIKKITGLQNREGIPFELSFIDNISSLRIFSIRYLDSKNKSNYFDHGVLLVDESNQMTFYLSLPYLFHSENRKKIEDSYYCIFKLDKLLSPLNMFIFKGDRLSSFSLLSKKENNFTRQIIYDYNRTSLNDNLIQSKSFTYQRIIKYLNEGTFLQNRNDTSQLMEIEIDYNRVQFGLSIE